MAKELPKKQLQPEDRARLDGAMTDLEAKVAQNPSDDTLVDILLTLQESYLPEKDGIGNYTDCQKEIFHRVTETDLRDLSETPDLLKGHIKTCKDIFDEHDIYSRNNILQVYLGKVNKINDVVTNCVYRLGIFTEKRAISKLCLTCFKVQILPATFYSLMKTCMLLKYIEFPRDNFRKCMVELRDYSPYAYKGVIYCESEEEAEKCSEIVQEALKAAGVTDVVYELSHGCTEFGMAYPGYKYSPEGRHRWFRRPK